LLWYGYIYYLFFFLTLFLGTNFLLRLFLVQFFFQTNALNDYTKFFVPTLLAFFFVTFTTLYLTFDYYISTTTLWLAADLKSTCFAYGQTLALFDLCHLQLNYTEVYFFPFIYIFFLITTISILFCLAYNLSETISFFFYTTLILVAGYVLFFTDSLILFFLSYEILLIPSFLILYNFAKTRRCVEAAYLMFF
jgi:formate hydrogenlyase subunit 3/multisubunit Na+/H+ antiporter MnhD subunit